MVLSSEIGLIILFSILGGVLAVRFRQPSMLGLLIIGAIVGPHNLGFIKDASIINAAIEIGAILLLFTVGIEFSLGHLINFGLRAISIAIIKLGSVFLISYYSSLLLGFDLITALFIGVILSITSTVIVIRILDQKGMSKRAELPLLVTILIVEDIFGVFALTFFSRLNTRLDLAPLNLLTSLIVSLTLMAVAYIVLQKILKPVINWLVRYSAEDTITFISVGLCGGMSYLALLLNLSPSVGAFLAGNLVSSLPNSKAFEKSIHPFTLTFTSLFFFSIGTIVNFSVILNSLFIVIALFFVNVLAKFLSIGFGSYLLTNFNGRQAVFSGIAMVSVGEFSLLIAREASGIGFGIDLVSITAAIILLSSIVMSVLLNYNDKIYSSIARLLPARAKDDMKLTSKYLNNVSWFMAKDKTGVKKLATEWKVILNNVIVIFFAFVFLFFFWKNFGIVFVDFLKSKFVLRIIAAVLFLILFFRALNIWRNFTGFLRDLLKIFEKIYPSEISNEKKLLRNIVLLSVFFIILLIFPSIFIFFSFNPRYNIIGLFLIALILIYIFKSSIVIEDLTKKHKSGLNKFSKKYSLLMRKKMKLKDGKNE